MTNNLTQITALTRYNILTSTTTAGSGHPSSSLSATDIMCTLLFDGCFQADLENPNYINNDRLIFSKGHASPLFYSLYAVAGKITQAELQTLRKMDSRLEGHPTMHFPYTEAATGSLGQGLSIGLGMALKAKMDGLNYNTFVLLGDSEMAEGSNWEALQVASHYKLNNLIGILDVNRLGQRGETMEGWDLENYKAKCEAFGWKTILIDGHDISEIQNAFKTIKESRNYSDNLNTSDPKPTMIIAKTIKGKGVSFIENQDNWHGKALNTTELEKALLEIGEVDIALIAQISKPDKIIKLETPEIQETEFNKYEIGEKFSTRKAYGRALVNLGNANSEVVVLDAETSNSTFSIDFKKEFPNRFFEMYIAEQNMVGVALGFSRRNKIPFISTFAAFFSRAFDQIRMSQYSNSNIKFVGSHAGVSIGEDGSSQMALEDIAMFRAVSDMVVLYPSDAVSTEKLVALSAKHFGNVFLRITRADTEIIYNSKEVFEIGGSKTIRTTADDLVTIVAAGITLHEALAASDSLKLEGVNVRVIDLYSIKPLDKDTLAKACKETKAIIVVEDHYQEGGIYEAICGSGVITIPVHSLAVRKMSRSGKPQELLQYMEIDRKAIVKKVKSILEM